MDLEIPFECVRDVTARGSEQQVHDVMTVAVDVGASWVDALL